jgi:hypothetical protein
LPVDPSNVGLSFGLLILLQVCEPQQAQRTGPSVVRCLKLMGETLDILMDDLICSMEVLAFLHIFWVIFDTHGIASTMKIGSVFTPER